jgi:hypothetical protein
MALRCTSSLIILHRYPLHLHPPSSSKCSVPQRNSTVPASVVCYHLLVLKLGGTCTQSVVQWLHVCSSPCTHTHAPTSVTAATTAVMGDGGNIDWCPIPPILSGRASIVSGVDGGDQSRGTCIPPMQQCHLSSAGVREMEHYHWTKFTLLICLASQLNNLSVGSIDL